jgi:hypothetical protein
MPTFAAGGQRHQRDVALGLGPRQAGLGAGERRVDALGHRRDRDLATPLADLDHQRDVAGRRHVGQREMTFSVGRGLDQGVAGEDAATAIALRAFVEGLHGAVGNVDRHVVERQRAVGRVDGAAHRRGAAAGARDLEALEVLARAAAVVVAAAGVVTDVVTRVVAAASGESCRKDKRDRQMAHEGEDLQATPYTGLT